MSEPPIEEREHGNEMSLSKSTLTELPRDQLQRSGRYLPPPPQMSPPLPMRPSLPSVAPRQRAAIACLNCRKRKVRCVGRDSSESSRCTTCARTSRQCIFVAVRNEAFAPPYALDGASRHQQSRLLRSPTWQAREPYPYPPLRQQVVRDEKLWNQRQSRPNDWRMAEDRFYRPEERESHRPVQSPAHIAERPKMLMDRTSYSSEPSFSKMPRTSQFYQSSAQDSYLPGPWIGVHAFPGYGQHNPPPAIPVPTSFLPSVPSLNVIPAGPYPGPYNASWQHVKVESPLKSA